MDILINLLDSTVDRNNFDCGIENLNQYLARYALQNDKKSIGKTFVAVSHENRKKVLGYYTVSMAQVELQDLPREMQKGLPRYPVPAMRIGRLAIDLSAQGKGIGSFLLRDALLRALSLSSEVGTHCVLVDAIDENAKRFYLRYGFMAFETHPLTLVLPLKTIADSLKR